MSIKKEKLYYKKHTSDATPAYWFSIPNQTGDYVELTNLGCKIRGIHIHKLNGCMENITAALAEDSVAASDLCLDSLWGGELGKVLAEKVWTIADEGSNNIFLTYECLAKENDYNVDLQLGINVSWVNLNRLIVDFFLTPKEKVCIDFSTKLNVDNNHRSFALRSFCPIVERASGEHYEVQETEYKSMEFVPISNCTDVFLHPSDEIKPMVELSDKQSKLRISAYSSLSSVHIQTSTYGNHKSMLSILCSGTKAIDLEAGETLANRMIFGFDYIEDTIPDNAEPNPFSFFL